MGVHGSSAAHHPCPVDTEVLHVRLGLPCGFRALSASTALDGWAHSWTFRGCLMDSFTASPRYPPLALGTCILNSIAGVEQQINRRPVTCELINTSHTLHVRFPWLLAGSSFHSRAAVFVCVLIGGGLEQPTHGSQRKRLHLARCRYPRAPSCSTTSIIVRTRRSCTFFAARSASHFIVVIRRDESHTGR